MSQEMANKVRHLPCIAINTTYKLVPWAEVLYAHDARWWNNTPDAKNHPGLKVGGSGCPPYVRTLRNTGTLGYDPTPGCIRTGGNSGYQAIHFAMHAGARRILLLGYDMRGEHWHGRHAGMPNPESGLLKRWAQRFATLTEPAKELGVEIINCTPGSAVTCFPIMLVEDALARMVPCTA